MDIKQATDRFSIYQTPFFLPMSYSKITSKALLGFGVVLLGGCVSLNGAEQNIAFSSKSTTALVVMRVTPDYRVGMKKGDLSAGSFVNSDLRLFELNAQPRAGYIVAEVSPTTGDQAYAIIQVLPSGFSGPRYMPCDGKKAPTFQLKPGTINYIGDFNYLQDGKQLSVSYSVETDAAAAHLRSEYPGVSGTLAFTEPTYSDVNGVACNINIMIPVQYKR